MPNIRSTEPSLLNQCFLSMFGGLFMAVCSVHAVPLTLNYQGQILIDGAPYEGLARFKFALLDQNGRSQWSHDLSSANGAEPQTQLSLPVSRGLYSVRLGDTSLANMSALSAAVFTNDVLRLRVWFNDGTNGFQQLTPDRELSSVAFAVRADSARTVESIPPGLVERGHLAAGLTGELDGANQRLVSLEAQLQSVLAQLSALQNITGANSNGISALTDLAVASSTDRTDPILLGQGFAKVGAIAADTWQTGTGGPLARYQHSGTWTSNGLVVWGGTFQAQIEGDGLWLYEPESDSWTQLSPIDAPFERRTQTAVYTGEEILFWGGFCHPGYEWTGGRFNLAENRWYPVTTNGHPAARESHAAMWTGSRMVIWGGRGDVGVFGDGAVYDPAADAWESLDLPDAPAARYEFSFVDAGDRLLIWGGTDANGTARRDGAQLVVSNGLPVRWEPITTVGAPLARRYHTAVWTGQRMIVWGGSAGARRGDGASYDPQTDTWTALPNAGAPSAREHHGAVWTGAEMIVWGGDTDGGPTASGAAFNPVTGRWRTLENPGTPLARARATTVWTGDKLLIYGGISGTSIQGSPQFVSPGAEVHLFRKP